LNGLKSGEVGGHDHSCLNCLGKQLDNTPSSKCPSSTLSTAFAACVAKTRPAGKMFLRNWYPFHGEMKEIPLGGHGDK
jgi:hypothetical protein